MSKELEPKINLKPLNKRVIVSADIHAKESYALTKDVTLKIVKDIENFNGRDKNPVNATVIFGEGLVKGQEILLNHNTLHATNEIYDTEIKLPEGVNLYSVPETEIYLYRDAYDEDDECNGWQPYKDILIVKKVFEPYKGFMIMPATELLDRLFVIRGNYLNQVLITDKYCYYTILYQEATGRIADISRMRDNEFEVIAIDHSLTEKVLNGELLIGDDPDKCYKFKPKEILV